MRKKTFGRRTDSERADEDTENISITSLLDDRVPSHQEFVRVCRLKHSLARYRIISMNLEVAKQTGRQLSNAQRWRREYAYGSCWMCQK
jgi:hypothetical protein